MKEKKNKKRSELGILVISLMLVLTLFSISFVVADPDGVSSITVISNETKAATSAALINISGGYLARINLTANVQNTKWKAFLGSVVGQFTLDDASGSTIYDWTLSVTSGRVYATRNSSTIQWSSIGCSTTPLMETENFYLNQNGTSDNISATFSDTTHGAFFVGTTLISANSCPTLNTYVNNATQDTDFEEMVLHDGGSTVFATILEAAEVGFDGATYDFQMIVPENGSSTWTGKTPYYLYVEVN